MKRTLKITAIAMAVTVCLLLAFLAALQTRPVKEVIRARLESSLADALKLKVSIGALKGNLIRDVVVEDLRFADEEGPLLEVKRFDARYALLALLDKAIVVRSVVVEGPAIYLKKGADGAWNVAAIGGGGKEQKKKEQGSGPGWKFFLESAELKDGHIRVRDEKSGQTLEASLEVLGAFRDGILQVRTFSLRSPRSTITLAGRVDFASPKGGVEAVLDIPSLALKELGPVLGRGMADETAGGSIRVSGSLEAPRAEFRASVSPKQAVEGSINIRRGETIRADLFCTFQNLLVDMWVPEVSGEANGSLTAQLQGQTPETLQGEARLEITGSTVGGYDVHRVLFVTRMAPGLAATVQADVKSSLGTAVLSADLKLAGLVDEKQAASGTVSLKASGVDLTGLKPKPFPLRARDFVLDGSFTKEPGVSLDRAGVKGVLSVRDCTFREAVVQKAEIDGTYTDGSFSIDKAELFVPGGSMALKGAGEVRGDVKGSLSLDLGDLTRITAPFMAEPVKGQARGAFTVSGKTLRPVIDGTLHATRVSGAGISVDELALRMTGKTEPPATGFDLAVKGANFAGNAVPFLELSGEASPERVEVTLKAKVEPSGTVELVGSATGLNTTRREIELSRLRAGLKGSIWVAQGPVSATVSPRGIEVRSLELRNGEQSMNLKGTLSLEGTSDFSASLKNITLADNLRLAGMKEPPRGLLTAEVHVTGAPESPLVKAGVDLKDIQWRENRLSKVSLDIDYADKAARVNGKVLAPDGNRLTIEGKAPINLALRTDEPRLPSSGLDLKVRGRNVNLAFVEALTPVVRKVQAVMNVDLRLTGDPHAPGFSGDFSLNGKRIELKDLGFPLQKVLLEASFDPTTVRIAKLSVEASNGTFEASGSMKHDRFTPKTMDLSVKSRRIPLPAGKLNPLLTSDLRAKGDLNALDLTGTLRMEDQKHGLDWSTPQPMSLVLGRESLTIKTFTLSGKNQEVNAKGSLSLKGTNDFSLALKKVRAVEILRSFIRLDQWPEGGLLNAQVNVTGTADAPLAKADMGLADLTWKGKEYGLSAMNLKADYANRRANISGTVRATDGNSLSLKGVVPVDLAFSTKAPRLGSEGLDLRVTGDKMALNFLAGMVPDIKKLDARADVDIKATGNPLAPSLDGRASLKGNSLALNATDYTIGPFAASVSFTPERVKVETFTVTLGREGSLDFKGEVGLRNYHPEKVDASLTTRAVPLPVKGGLPSLFTSNLTLRGPLDELSLGGTLELSPKDGKGAWQTAGPISVTIKPETVAVRSVSLVSGKQTVSASGTLSLKGTSDLKVRVGDLDIKGLLALAGVKNGPSGVLNMDGGVSGTAEAPAIKADLSVRSISYQSMEAADLEITARYADRRATVTGKMQAAKGGSFSLQSVVPVNLAFTAGGDRLSESGLELTVRGDKVDLSFLSAFIPDIKEAKATLDLDVKASGNPKKPTIVGTLAMEGQRLQLARLKQPIQQIVLKSSFGADSVKLTTLSAQVGEKGRISADGAVSLADYRPANVDLNLKANDVPVDYGGDLKTVLSMDMKGSGPPAGLTLKGKLELADGEVRVDRITERADRNVVIVDTVVEGEEKPKEEKKPSDIYKGMTVRVHLLVPGKMWVRGVGTNIEMKGDLQLSKDPGGDMRINGEINTVRGFYEYAEKVFTIQEGRVTFIGLKEPDPNLDITAVLKIKETQIFCKISGTASKPTVKLTSDPPMDDSDIISYLVFGSPVSGLSRSQASNLQNTATAFIGGMVAKNLKDILGGPFNFDIVQYQGGTSGLTGGSLELGKYVSPKVFMTYRRKFGENGGNEVAVEYEITDHFGIESQIGDNQTTGADFIWRYKY